MTELYDLMATFLDLAGVQAMHTHFARSLTPQVRGTPGDSNRAAFTEGGYDIYEPQAFEPKLGGLYGPKTALQNDRPESVSRCAAIRTQREAHVRIDRNLS
jgi:arylsulfatase A-like enzyme